GRREHQQPALHALARPLPLLHGGGEPRAGHDRRGEGHLPQRLGRRHGADLRARGVRQVARLGHHHDRLGDRLQRHPVHREVGAAQRHDPAPAPRRPLHLHAAEDARRELPRHSQVDALGGRGPHPRRHRGGQAGGRPGHHPGLLRHLPRAVQPAGLAERPVLRPGLGEPAPHDAGGLGRHPRRADAPAPAPFGRGLRAPVRRRHHRPPDGHPGRRHRQPRGAGGDDPGPQRRPRLHGRRSGHPGRRGAELHPAGAGAGGLEGRDLQLRLHRHARLRPHRHRGL
ncbi:MAG: Ribulose bisphosphate carboxylase large chain, partial [uncultured Acetobacteraceae bacterium]